MLTDKKAVIIKIKSCVDDVEREWECAGEYAIDGETRVAVYTDYIGNDITRTGMQIGKDAMLLHRSGGINADMLFSLENDTVLEYEAFGLKTTYVLHTAAYRVYEMDHGLWVHLEYSLNDTEGKAETTGVQDFYIFYDKPQEKRNL